MEQEVLHSKWLVWHGKYHTGIERLERMCDSLGEWPEGEYLHIHLDQTRVYLSRNRQLLVIYARRHYKGLPVLRIPANVISDSGSK